MVLWVDLGSELRILSEFWTHKLNFSYHNSEENIFSEFWTHKLNFSYHNSEENILSEFWTHKLNFSYHNSEENILSEFWTHKLNFSYHNSEENSGETISFQIFNLCRQYRGLLNHPQLERAVSDKEVLISFIVLNWNHKLLTKYFHALHTFLPASKATGNCSWLPTTSAYYSFSFGAPAPSAPWSPHSRGF